MNKTTEYILLTGGCGFIGSHTAVELLEKGHNVIIVDNLSNSYEWIIDNIKKITKKDVIFELIDCCDYDKLENVFKKYNISSVIHFAANKCVGESVEYPLKYYKNNIFSLVNILNLMTKYGIKNIVFSSSCTVYGQPDKLPVTEDTPIQKPNCPYGNTKQISEEIIIDTIKSNKNINSIILRYFNPIGAHPTSLIGELPIGEPQNLIPYIMQTAIGKRDKLKVFGGDYNTKDGTCIRDYIDITDLAKAHVISVERMINNENEDNFEIFNLGTGEGKSVLEIIEVFEKVSNVKLNYEIVDRRQGDVEKIYADPTKANKMLGWKAITNIEDTIRHAWLWEMYLNNMENEKTSTRYKFQCPQCGQNYEVEGMPPIEIFKQIPHTMTCPKCGEKVPMIQ